MPKNKKHKYYKHRSRLAKAWRRYEYKHTSLALLIVLLFIAAVDTAVVQSLLLTIEEAGLLGIFLTGILFVSFLTAGPATLILVSLAPDYNSLTLAALAGAGSLIGDWLIINFFEDKVSYELRPLARKYGLMPIIRQMKTKKFRPFAIIAGMLMIASPLPDEAGLALLGIAKAPMRWLLPAVFALNAGGILLLVWAARQIAGEL